MTRELAASEPDPGDGDLRSVLAAGLGLCGLIGLVTRRGPTRLDRLAHRTIRDRRRPSRAPAARAVTALGSTPVAYAALAVTIWLRHRRAGTAIDWRTLAVAAGGTLTRRALAELVGRPRPPRGDWMADAHGPSFPSRHTTTAVLLGELIAETAGLRGARRAVVYATAAAVSASRLWLGMHWLTDVAGGWLFAIGWRRVADRLLRPSNSDGSES